MTEENITRSYFLEGILELGRNWALAVAIASAGLVASRTETIDGPQHWEQHVFIACAMTACLWMVLAVLRFEEGLTHRVKGKGWLARFSALALYAFLAMLGVSVITVVSHFSWNNEVVQICDSAKGRADSKIPHYDECKRLQAQRQIVVDKLEGRNGAPAGRE
ncbi:TPA: hypothetical protein ACKP4S_000365 [Stenotrophomonas maltophilia]|jgi:hypothetical protein|uniref:hypothetical protein n=1 Tax=Stenotrophomonas sp. SMYL86 TaxID=3076044 RepID=UPI002E77BCA7|nr:hypothetical protein [Stenotrophomonas sp. SMYL86]